MNNKQSTVFKLTSLLVLIIGIIITQFILIKNLKHKYENSINTLKVFDQNNKIINEIVLNCNTYYFNQNAQLKENISKKILEYNYASSVLMAGGKIPILNETIVLQYPSNDFQKKLQEIELLWNDFQIQLNNFLKSKDLRIDEPLKKIHKQSNLIIIKLNVISNDLTLFKRKTEYKLSYIYLVSILLQIILLITLYYFIKKNYINSINTILFSLKKFIKGENPNKNPEINSPETTEFFNLIDQFSYKTNDIYTFVNRLLEDKYDTELNDYNPNDNLEVSLIKLRNKLKENIEQNRIKLFEEQERLKFSEIQTQFNDILRDSAANIKILAEASLVNLVKVFKASVGGFFILRDDMNPPYLELISSFAYDRIKSLTKTIYPGDGLIGMCAVEKNTIFLDKIPPGYMEIESGLGESSPESLLILPLKSDENLLGVIEIASFNKFSRSEINFIEKITEDIASTLETTKISDRTNMLLEESQKKSDELALRDSEMSDKIVQLREIQTETKRSEILISTLISGIDRILLKAELDLSGKFINANNLFIQLLKYNINDLKNIRIVDILEQKNKEISIDLLKQINKNESVITEFYIISKQNEKFSTKCIFTPVKNENDQIVKILFLAENTSYLDEMYSRNHALQIEIEKKSKIIIEKEDTISKLKQIQIEYEKNSTIPNINEENLKNIFESKTEKKYHEWLYHFKMNKEKI